MATNDDAPTAPQPASGEPAEPTDDPDDLVPDDAQVALIGNMPDGLAQQGAIRPGKESPDGLDG